MCPKNEGGHLYAMVVDLQNDGGVHNPLLVCKLCSVPAELFIFGGNFKQGTMLACLPKGALTMHISFQHAAA